MIKKFLKEKLKIFLFKLNFKLEKIYVQNNYNLETPDLSLLKSMSNSKGILHIGSHRGSEAAVYEWFGKKVIWIEANPKIFIDLKINIKQFKFQKAICALLTNKDNERKNFYISNNDGASSSIYEFGNLSSGAYSLWKNKNLKMIDEINLKTKMLDTVIEENNVDIKNYDHWIIDVQGAELLVLEGSKKNIKFCNSIYIEVSKGDVYKNGSQWEDIKKLLNEFGLKQIKEIQSEHENVLFTRI
jgi:FkbM family methyltransferase